MIVYISFVVFLFSPESVCPCTGDKYYLQNRLGFETLTAHRHQRSVVGPHNACVGQSVAPEHIIHETDRLLTLCRGTQLITGLITCSSCVDAYLYCKTRMIKLFY